jgi:hypothetical protein
VTAVADEHPSVAGDPGHRVVLVAVKYIDAVAVHAGECARRIPAADYRAIHVDDGEWDFDVAFWLEQQPDTPLHVVESRDVTSALVGAVRRWLASPGVEQVVVVLSDDRPPATSGDTLRTTLAALRTFDRVAPVVVAASRS